MARSPELDQVFQALGDPTRRAVLQRLCRGAASVSELSAPFEMALPSFVQHLKVLEACGLMSSRKTGRVRTCRLNPRPLQQTEQWLGRQRSLWEKRLNQLDSYVLDLNAKEKKT